MTLPTLPPVNTEGVIKPEPEEIVARRMRKCRNQALVELLVRWQGQNQEDATWESYSDLRETYPHLVGKVF